MACGIRSRHYNIGLLVLITITIVVFIARCNISNYPEEVNSNWYVLKRLPVPRGNGRLLNRSCGFGFD